MSPATCSAALSRFQVPAIVALFACYAVPFAPGARAALLSEALDNPSLIGRTFRSRRPRRFHVLTPLLPRHLGIPIRRQAHERPDGDPTHRPSRRATYRVDTSTNFLNWTPLTIATMNSNGFFNFTDPPSTLRRKFYRAVLP